MNLDSLKSIYGDLPSLEEVWIKRVELNHNGPCLNIDLDLLNFPKSPPKKWLSKGYNKISLSIILIEISALCIEGWGVDNFVGIEITENLHRKEIKISGKDFSIRSLFREIHINNVSAYLDDSI